MTYKERTELNEISKRVFGVPSRWRKLVERGRVQVDATTKAHSRSKDIRYTTQVTLNPTTVKIYMLELERQAQEKLEEIRKKAANDNQQIKLNNGSDQATREEVAVETDSAERELPGAE